MTPFLPAVTDGLINMCGTFNSSSEVLGLIMENMSLVLAVSLFTFTVWKNEKGPDRMFKTQLNCARYVAPSDLKEIQHPVTAFSNFHTFCKQTAEKMKVLTCSNNSCSS